MALNAATTPSQVVKVIYALHSVSNVSIDPDFPDAIPPSVFAGLEKFLEAEGDRDFYSVILPTMVKNALMLRDLRDKNELVYSLQQEGKEITLERPLVASLLAHMFFGTLPRRTGLSHPTLTDPSLVPVLTSLHRESQQVKLRAFFQYFRALSCWDMTSPSAIKIGRKVMTSPSFVTLRDWASSSAPLCSVVVYHEGRIESHPAPCHLACFTSANFARPALTRSTSQQVSTMLSYPELLVTAVLAECLEDNEALLVNGTLHTADVENLKSKPALHLMENSAVADVTHALMDADNYYQYEDLQYEEINLLRELNKALLAFSQTVACSEGASLGSPSISKPTRVPEERKRKFHLDLVKGIGEEIEPQSIKLSSPSQKTNDVKCSMTPARLNLEEYDRGHESGVNPNQNSDVDAKLKLGPHKKQSSATESEMDSPTGTRPRDRRRPPSQQNRDSNLEKCQTEEGKGLILLREKLEGREVRTKSGQEIHGQISDESGYKDPAISCEKVTNPSSLCRHGRRRKKRNLRTSGNLKTSGAFKKEILETLDDAEPLRVGTHEDDANSFPNKGDRLESVISECIQLHNEVLSNTTKDESSKLPCSGRHSLPSTCSIQENSRMRDRMKLYQKDTEYYSLEEDYNAIEDETTELLNRVLKAIQNLERERNACHVSKEESAPDKHSREPADDDKRGTDKKQGDKVQLGVETNRDEEVNANAALKLLKKLMTYFSSMKRKPPIPDHHLPHSEKASTTAAYEAEGCFQAEQSRRGKERDGRMLSQYHSCREEFGEMTSLEEDDYFTAYESFEGPDTTAYKPVSRAKCRARQKGARWKRKSSFTERLRETLTTGMSDSESRNPSRDPRPPEMDSCDRLSRQDSGGFILNAKFTSADSEDLQPLNKEEAEHMKADRLKNKDDEITDNKSAKRTECDGKTNSKEISINLLDNEKDDDNEKLTNGYSTPQAVMKQKNDETTEENQKGSGEEEDDEDEEDSCSSRYSFSSDYISDLEEVYDQLGQILHDVEEGEIGPRTIAVAQFAQGLLKRALSDTYKGLSFGLDDSASRSCRKQNVLPKSDAPRSLSFSGHQADVKLTKPDQMRLTGATGDRTTEECMVKNNKKMVVTGNWGCGSLKGDHQLKAMIQWAACSKADAPGLVYYTYGNPNIAELEKVVSLIQKRGWHTGQLVSAILKFSSSKLGRWNGRESDLTESADSPLTESRREKNVSSANLFQDLMGVDQPLASSPVEL